MIPTVCRSTPIMTNSASTDVISRSKYALFLFSSIRQSKGITIGADEQDIVFMCFGFAHPEQLFKLNFGRHTPLSTPIGRGGIIAGSEIIVVASKVHVAHFVPLGSPRSMYICPLYSTGVGL